MISGVGPTKIRPAAAQASANCGILGQEAVAGMDRIDLRGLRDADDVVDIEVGLDRRLAGADEIALVRLHPVQREAVFLRVDRDRADAQLGRRAHDADGDLAAVGDQEAADALGHGAEHNEGRRRLPSVSVRAQSQFAMDRCAI